MRPQRLRQIALPFLFAVFVLGGCASMLPVTQMTPAGDVLVTVTDPALKDKATARVSYTGLLEHVEYVSYKGDGLTMEAAYDVVIGDRTVLEYPYTIDRMLETWNLNAGQGKRWGSQKTMRGWHGTIDYQPYVLTAANRSCAAFNGEWDHSPRDPYGRPTQVFFGYICAEPGQALSNDRTEALLKSVRIDQRFGETFVKPGMRASFDKNAHDLATGSARAGTGNAIFPFEFGATYSEGDGNDFSG